MRKKIKEIISVYTVKYPSRVILMAILLFNIFLLALSAMTISLLTPDTMKNSGFFESIFYTVSMILDAGCIQYVVEDIGEASVTLIFVCLATILIGMITFTGAVIGYVTNYISNFIEHSQSGNRPINVSGHTVILNWNSRASEIVNEMLYSGRKETVIIVSGEDAERIRREIDERISVSINEDNERLYAECRDMGLFKRLRYVRKNKVHNRLTIIIRSGDTYSTKQLNDVSLLNAKAVIILGKDIQTAVCKYEMAERASNDEKGNSNLIKTLVQVSEITGSEKSADNQVIVVEIDDDWTANMVDKIIEHKENLGKCNIIPVPVNRILGQIFSQFSIMPELNFIYGELFSNKGAEFFCQHVPEDSEENRIVREKLYSCAHAVPLGLMDTKTGKNIFYMAETEQAVSEMEHIPETDYKVEINENYWLEKRDVIIIGHNTNAAEIMTGFESFRDEWNYTDGTDILNVMVIDDAKSLEKRQYYEKYPFVNKIVEADVYDADAVKTAVADFVKTNGSRVSILILSDDNVVSDDIDSNALTYLIYVQDVIKELSAEDPDFNRNLLNVIVEIVNPKNFDVVRSYSVDNVIISNRYISKMVEQISEKESLFEFYHDILTYDETSAADKDIVYDSKELYVKKVSRFFRSVPGPCTAMELIRAVYDATPENNKAVILGYINAAGEMTLFSDDQRNIHVNLTENDRVIMFCNH